jgi:hypothetical protein
VSLRDRLRRSGGEPRLLVHGHSLALGAGTSDQERLRFSRLVADALGLREENHSVGGAIAHWSTYGDVGDGGWPAVLEYNRGRAPYLAPGDIGLLYYGANDLAVLGRNLRPYTEALRTMISRYRAEAVNDIRGGVAVELPDGFAGGTIAVGFTARPDHRARAAFATDGAAAGELELTGSELCFGERANAVVKRLTVPAGARTIEVSCDVAPDYWQIEADTAPPVAVLTQFPLAHYDVYVGWPGHPLSDADVTEALNPATRAVAAEFGAAVHVVEIEDAFPDGYAVSWDAYPDDAGYARLAEVVTPQVAQLREHEPAR